MLTSSNVIPLGFPGRSLNSPNGWNPGVGPANFTCYSDFDHKTHHFWNIRLQKWCHLENRVKGPWRSLKMSPFDREPRTSYWCSIVTIALSRVVSEIFNAEKYRDLEIPVKSQSRSLKVPSVFYGKFVPKAHRFWDIWLQSINQSINQLLLTSKQYIHSINA